jgi:hypothetical protein
MILEAPENDDTESDNENDPSPHDAFSGTDSMSPSGSDSRSDSDVGPLDAFSDGASDGSEAQSDFIGPEDAFLSSESDAGSDAFEVSATEAAAALADTDSEMGDGSMVLAAVIAGQLATGGHTQLISGPFTADSFPPIPRELLSASSQGSDSE